MKERPILFSGAMVRALLDGTKTQTRRVVKVHGELPPAWATFAKEGHHIAPNGTRPTGLFYWSEEQTPGTPLKVLRRWPLERRGPMSGSHYHARCPYGVPGDRLWVRETWAYKGGEEYLYQQEPSCVQYRATDQFAHSLTGEPQGDRRWRPSIFMPRWACRIVLTITDVRVERLQDISEVDARAEGVGTWRDGWSKKEATEAFLQGTAARVACAAGSGTAQRLYYLLWDSINAKRGFGWDANPWVWVITFAKLPGGS